MKVQCKETGDIIEIPEGHKQCSREGCYAIKPLDEFYKDKRSKDGRARQCKTCQKKSAKKSHETRDPEQRRKQQRKSYIKNGDKRREYARERYANMSEEDKAEYKAKHKAYRESDAGREVQKDAQARRRMLMEQNAGTPYTRYEVVQESMGDVILPDGSQVKRPICAICNEPIMDAKQLHIDHIVPIAKGGVDGKENVRVTCAQCNLERPRTGDDITKDEGVKGSYIPRRRKPKKRSK